MARSGAHESQNLQIIDLVRSVCILMVVFFHYTNCVMGQCNLPPTLLSTPEWPSETWRRLSQNGTYGVLLFFVVSGFLITRVISKISGDLLKPDLRQFYIRRAARIFPLYFLIVLFGVVIFYFFQSQDPAYSIYFKRPDQPHGFKFWGSIATFTTNWFFLDNAGKFPLFGIYWLILWSLSIEEQFYFFYPIIIRTLKIRKNLYLFLSAAILTGPLVRNYDVFHNPQYGSLNIFNTFGIFDTIAFGALLYLLSEDLKSFLKKNKTLCVILCVFGFGILTAVYFGTFYQGHADQIFEPTALSIGLFLFLLGGLHLDFFQSSFLWVFSLPGKLSYGIYLLHELVFYSIRPFLTHENALPYFIASLLILLAASTLSYRFFEVPSNLFIRDLLKNRSAAEQKIARFLSDKIKPIKTISSAAFTHCTGTGEKIRESFMKLPLGNKIALCGFGLAVFGIGLGFWGAYFAILERAVILGIAVGTSGSFICLLGLFWGKFPKK